MKLSIIIPVYNSEKYLSACLDSCMNQSPYVLGKDYEIVCVNDGSTDGSTTILESYQQSGINVVFQSNQGVSTARNNGLNHAVGEYVWFVDSDDLIIPHVIDKAITYIHDNDADCMYFRLRNIPQNYKISEYIYIYIISQKQKKAYCKTHPLR